MKQLALTLDLVDDPEGIAAYKKYHEAIWPEVRDSLKKVGIHEMKIWLLGRRLFMMIEVDDTFDPEAQFARYHMLHPRVKEWEQLMGQYQQQMQGASGGGRWALMEQIFQLTKS